MDSAQVRVCRSHLRIYLQRLLISADRFILHSKASVASAQLDQRQGVVRVQIQCFCQRTEFIRVFLLAHIFCRFQIALDYLSIRKRFVNYIIVLIYDIGAAAVFTLILISFFCERAAAAAVTYHFFQFQPNPLFVFFQLLCLV